LDLHTESMLEAGEAKLLTFQKCLQHYLDIQGNAQTNWNFQKVYSPKHAFQDIHEKGASRNFSTQQNEGQHHTLIHAYQLQTNNKNVADQEFFRP
ncbi:hypothetical protein BS17DRAFT_719742, partial [Gyrodon lividus]